MIAFSGTQMCTEEYGIRLKDRAGHDRNAEAFLNRKAKKKKRAAPGADIRKDWYCISHRFIIKLSVLI